MRPFNVKLICFFSLFIGFAVFIGCGENEALDEQSTRISASILPLDGGDAASSIDIIQGDCNGTAEDFFDFDVQLTVQSAADAPEFRIEGYDVNLRPDHGVYERVIANEPAPPVPPGFCIDDGPAITTTTGVFDFEMATLNGTILNPLNYIFTSTLIPPNSTFTFDGLLVWTASDKIFYRDVLLPDAGFDGIIQTFATGCGIRQEGFFSDFVYEIQLVLHCKEENGGEFTVVTPWVPFHLTNVDNC